MDSNLSHSTREFFKASDSVFYRAIRDSERLYVLSDLRLGRLGYSANPAGPRADFQAWSGLAPLGAHKYLTRFPRLRLNIELGYLTRLLNTEVGYASAWPVNFKS